ncbi:MAG: fructosamine kinase family protein [Burkholderiales bacterium]|nr:MAG: fructosamine kinase family protein [Burkholderiales bacterium]
MGWTDVQGRDRAVAEEALRAAGLGAVRAMHAVGGGDIAAAYRVEAGVQRAFLKVGAGAHPFDAEAAALAEIGATRTLRAPRVLAHGVAADAGFLLLEWIDLAGDGDWAAAGRQLAALHACVQPAYGWPRDNTIGATPQFNSPGADWAEFYRERRLRPQFALARSRRLLSLAALEQRACRAADALLAGHAPPPSLLHGDLWRGNLAFDRDGVPVVFDPATYHGDAETDLAMTRLFGGFAERFYRAYDESRAPAAGAARRLPLYQLYHVLNHANLFGGGYVAQAIALIGRL